MFFALIALGALLVLFIVDVSLIGKVIGEERILGMVLGGAIGGLLAAVLQLKQRLDALEKTIGSGQGTAPIEDRRKAAESPPEPERPTAVSPTPATATATPATTAPPSPAIDRSAGSKGPALGARLGAWLTSGNLPVRIGVLVLLVGVAGLLRLAVDQGWLALPIEARLSGVAILALGGLVWGFGQRVRRPLFSLAIQGGAIGVLILVTHAAASLYSVLPTLAGLLILILLVAGTVALAWLQNALSLAVLALIAAFAAPLLVGDPDGNHVFLFSYYSIVNLAVFALSLARPWHLLNRLGFLFTFVIATWWGVLEYRPELYASTQPFLLLWFALYLAIPIVHAHRSQSRSTLDVILVFGLPLIAFPLHAALLEGQLLAIAFSALGVAALYLALAGWLIRGESTRLLARAHAALALAFATLAVPLALDGSTTALIWAVEGAALLWYGLNRDYRLARLAGLGLQLLAAIAWWIEFSLPAREAGLAIINGWYIGTLAIAVAGVFSAWQLARHGATNWLLNLLTLWALLWWFGGSLSEIARHTEGRMVDELSVMFLGLSAWLAALASRHTGQAAAVAGVATALLVSLHFLTRLASPGPVLAALGILAWPAWFVLGWLAQAVLVDARSSWRLVIAVVFHAVVVVLLAVITHDLLELAGAVAEGWRWLAAMAPLALLIALVRFWRPVPLTPGEWPPPQHRLFSALAATVTVLVLTNSLFSSGTAYPLPYLPVLNPLELTQLITLVLLALVLSGSTLAQFAGKLLGLLFFGFVTMATLRGVHHFNNIDWSMSGLMASRSGQAALSVTWAALGVAAWIAGSRLQRRNLWLAGAVLLAVVLLKLVLVDRQFLSTIAGVVSFLAFGLLSILVGFLAPAPPRRQTVSEEQG